MALKISRADVWAASIEDRPGGTAEKLEPLAQAGANLEFLIARRSPENPGKGVLFVTPVKGARAARAARQAGFAATKRIHSLRVEGPDRQGAMAKLARALTDAGISFRGLSAAAIGKRFVAHLAVDSAAQARQAAAVLRKLA
ncbi:MAG: amino acid-binding protein [Burkholderiales bacterium]|nr:amino acid-binding protein [Burkholderiales bacterium]